MAFRINYRGAVIEADTARRVEAAYLRVLSRQPTAAEQARALRNAAKDLAIFVDLIGEDHA